MKINRLFIIGFFAVALIAAVGIPTRPQLYVQNGEVEVLIAGRNVNMVSEGPLPYGDPYLQRQNEPSLAVSSRNPMHLLAGSNDYRTVDMPIPDEKLPGVEGTAAADAWLGYFTSDDGAESWKTALLPGFPQDNSTEGLNSPIKGFSTAADPWVLAGSEGRFYYSGLAFNRGGNESAIFVARFEDTNDKENGNHPDHPSNTVYRGNTVVVTGNAGQFVDMPRMVVDVPRGANNDYVFLVYAVFVGNLEKNIKSKMYCTRSTDGGLTWSSPTKLSESQHIIQGAAIAIDPLNGDVYVAFRRFYHKSQESGIVIVKSTNRGSTFSSPQVIETFTDDTFDQPATNFIDPPTGETIRTNSYPTIAVDDNHIVYVAWSQRGFGADTRDSRIVMKASYMGSGWDGPFEIDPPASLHQGHEFMPQMAFAAGKLTLVWYDQRQDWSATEYGYDAWISERLPERHTIDVWAAQADAHTYPNLNWSYTQVSRYIYIAYQDENGHIMQDANGNNIIIPAQYNCLNLPMFKGGTIPFMGDYISLAASPTIFADENGDWVFNTAPSDNPVFHVAWTDNRDVRSPSGAYDWSMYVPVYSQSGYVTPGRNQCAPEMVNQPAIRNQNIYTSKLSWGVMAGAYANNKALDLGEDIARTFAIFVKNTSGAFRNFRLFITNQPPNGEASFLQFDYLTELDVTIAAYSTISRPVFVKSDDLDATIKIEIWEYDASWIPIGNDPISYIILNNDPSDDGVSGGEEDHIPIIVNPDNPNIVNWVCNPNIVNPNIVNDPLNPNIVNPNIVNPNIVNPNIVNDPLNPNIVNPNIVNPNIVNPNIVNPNIVNPNIVNPNIVNPNIVNPNIVNPNIVNAAVPESVPITDVTWNVRNDGNIASTFTLKALAKKSPPPGIYTQLLIYRVHYTPGIAGEELVSENNNSENNTYQSCELYREPHHELLLNLVNPNIVNPNIVNPNIVNPNIVNAAIENATFTLGPGEEALVDLRVMDIAPETREQGVFTQDLHDKFSIQAFNLQDYIENLGFAVTAHAVGSVDVREGKTTPRTTATDLFISTPGVHDGSEEVGYEAILDATGGITPYSWSLEWGNLPPGLNIIPYHDPPVHDNSAKISGSPDPGSAGTYQFMVKVTDSSNPQQTATARYTITIHAGAVPQEPTIETTSLSFGIVDDFYGVTMLASGGDPPLTWTWAAGSTALPEGLSMDTSGIISGYPTTEGTYNVAITVTDLDGSSDTENFNLVIQPATTTFIKISGYVYDETTGDPLEGVLMRGLPNEPYTDAAGYYEDDVRAGWEGTVIPFMVGHTFNPTHRDYTSAQTVANIPNQDYNLPISMIVISGTVNIGSGSGVGIQQLEGVTMVGLPGEPVTDMYGYYEAFVPDSWTGTVTPTKEGYIFEPVSRTYDIVQSNQESQDYDGVEGWITRYHNESATNIDMGYKIATDIWGKLYVTGMTDSSPSGLENFDTITFKQDPSDGSIIWNTLYDRYQDNPMDIGVFSQADDDDYVFVAAFPYSGSYNNDFATVRYRGETGAESWSSIYDNTPIGHEDEVNALAVDAWGDVYVTGMSDSDPDPYSRSWDYTTVKYDGDTGGELWVARYEGADNDVPLDIIVDPMGNVYVTGYSSNGADHDIRTIKYDRDGTELWNQTYDSTFGDDWGKVMALDPAGYVYVAAEISSDTNGTDFGVLKYDLNGNFVWVTTYNNAANNEDDSPKDMAIDGAGNIYVTGTSDGGEGYDDIVTVKFIDQGATAAFGWGAIYDGPAFNNDRAFGLVIDPHDQIYITGESRSDEGDYDYVTIKYRNTGPNSFTTLWTRTYDGEYGDDSPRDIALCTFGNIYLTGESTGDMTDYDFATLKYSQFFDSLVITSTTFQDGVVDAPYAVILGAFGSSGPRYWSIASGSLPPGLFLEASTGVIYGSPDAVGTFDFELTVQDGILSDTRSFSMTVSTIVGPAFQLAFSQQPSNTAVGATIPTVTLEIQDAAGNLVMTATDEVTLTLIVNPGDAGLGGTTTKAAVDGIATFDNLSINEVATGYVLRAESDSLTEVDSNPFDILAGAATQILVETAPDGSGTVVPAQTVPSGSSITVYAISRDLFGNYIENCPADSWLLVNKTGGVLDGDLAGNVTSAVFTGNLAGTAQIRAIKDGLTSVDSGTITVSSGGALATKIELTGPAKVGGGFISEALTITAQDDIGTPTPVAQNTVFNLSSDSSGISTFYSDSEGTTPITQATIPAGQDSVTFYYMDDVVGTPTVTAAWSDGGSDLDSDDHQTNVWAVVGQIVFFSNRDGNGEIYLMNADGSNPTRLTYDASADNLPSWSPDGSKVAFRSWRDGNDEIYVMNADGSNPTRLTDNSASDNTPSWSPDGSKIAFEGYRDGDFEVFVMDADGSNQTQLTDNTAFDSAPCWSPDGSKIAFFSNRGGNYDIYVMNANGTAQTRLTDNAAVEGGPSWSPDGSKIAFYSNRDGNNEIYVMNANGTAQTRLTDDSPNSNSWPSWSPDGSKIAFLSNRDGNDEIYIMNADGSDQTNVTNNSAIDNAPCWGGAKIAFYSARDGNDEIYFMNADGSGQTNLTDNSASDMRPSWSPDGTKIVFQSNRDDTYPEIYTMDADGSNVTRLTNDPEIDMSPSWSPYGNKIVFVSRREGNDEIYIMDAGGSNITRLTENSATDLSPSWSPDGTKIVFVSSQHPPYYDVYIMDADGSNVTRLTDNSANDSWPSWSPNGTKILFVSHQTGNVDIYVMDTDGSNVTRLTNDPAIDNYPCWSPDGRKIVFVSDRDGNNEIYIMDADGTNVTRLTGNSGDYNRPSWRPQARILHEYEFMSALDESGSGDGQFNNPMGIVIDSLGYVFIADSDNYRVQKFQPGLGSFLLKWGGTLGSGDGQFDSALGMAVDNSGYVYVADAGLSNDRIQKFDSDGNFVAKWGSRGTNDGQFNTPRDVAVDSSDNIYVVDMNNNRIQKFDSDGNFILKWGSSGTGDGEFTSPHGIAIDGNDNVYVTDRGFHRIQKFDTDGNFITKWGSNGTGNGQFNHPCGIAVDNDGFVYVVDQSNNRIQKFNSIGMYLTQWGSTGSENGQFNVPSYIAIDSDGYVYITDSYNDRVQKFRRKN